MNTKIIILDINKKLRETINAKQGDTASRFLLFHLLDGSVPINLTNRSVRVYGKKKDGTEIFNDLIVNDATKGYCTLELTSQMLAVVGVVELEIVIYEGTRKLSSIPFLLDVLRSVNSDNAIVSTNEFTALMSALSSLADYDNYKNEITAARGTEVDLAARFDKTSEQLAEKANQTDVRLKVEKMQMEDMSDTVISAISGGTTVNVLSIPQDASVNATKTDFFSYDNVMSLTGIVVGGLNSVGTINTTQTTYSTSDFIPVVEGKTYFIPGYILYFCYYNVNKTSLTSTIPREGASTDSYKTIQAGVSYMRVTWLNTSSTDVKKRTDDSVKIYNTSNLNLLKPFKEKSISLNAINGNFPELTQKDDKVYLEYIGDYKTLYIYMKTVADNTYLCYRFKRMTAVYDANNSSSNYDIWRLRGVGVYTKNLDNTFNQTYSDTLIHESSEWECAIKETGLDDFTGGSTHGDEFLDNIVFFLDGIAYTDVTQLNGKNCKELKIIRKSRLYRANTNSAVQIANHYVDYLFKNNTITIDNRIDWLVDTNCGISYLCMLGARRLNGTTQITSSAMKDGEAIIYDVSVDNYSNGAFSTLNKCKKAFLWNDKGTGLKTSMSVEILDSNNFPNSNFKFDNRPDYNKFYFDHCGLNFAVTNGDKWYNKALYKIDYLGTY